ncbi:MAG TPA: triose-phosphate isomerase [Nitrososphaerales archaeon]|nr:triose-phosphate isomerase [Nitrososphaerales archaeon]
MKTLIVNFKNYVEVLGDGSVRLALAVERVSDELGIEGIVAPPTPMLSLVCSRTRVQVYSQSVGSDSGDKTTGEILPEAVKAAGAAGTILNHSESRRPPAELRILVPRLAGMGMGVCLCAQTAEEAADLSALGPKYLAIEPPELIGSGVAVSKARPELVRETVAAVRNRGYGGRILCGAGIVSGEDVAMAVKLGVDGVLVASSVVKAHDWDSRVRELAGSLS